MLHKNRIWQVSDWNVTSEQMTEIAKESDWNFCLCQAFHLLIAGREIHFLNDSIHPDPLHYYQEYAPVIVTSKQETAPGRWRCSGFQIESLTVNMEGGTPLSRLLERLGDPAHDYQGHAVSFTLEAGESHSCPDCE
jgi:hypothetical protein